MSTKSAIVCCNTIGGWGEMKASRQTKPLKPERRMRHIFPLLGRRNLENLTLVWKMIVRTFESLTEPMLVELAVHVGEVKQIPLRLKAGDTHIHRPIW